MKRSLPKIFTRICAVKFPGNRHLILTDYFGQRRCFLFFPMADHQNCMDMIWHDHEFIHRNLRIKLRDLFQKLPGLYPQIIQFHRITEQTFPVMGAHCHKVIILCRIIISGDSGVFPWMKEYAFITFCIHNPYIVGGDYPAPTIIP